MLINLSDSALVSKRIATPEFLAFLVSYIFLPTSLLADLASMLLSNLTKLDAAAKTLLDMKMDPTQLGMGEDEELTALDLLLAAFDQGATVQSSATQSTAAAIAEMKKRAAAGDNSSSSTTTTSGAASDPTSASVPPPSSRKSNCNFLASVFANITALPAGREYFTTPATPGNLSTTPAGRLFSYTEHPDLIRRGGCISSLKNILFVKTSHAALIAPPATGSTLTPPLVRPAAAETSDLDVLPSLLLPLCTGKLFEGLDDEEQESLPEELQFLEEDKKMEQDGALRAMLVESLLLLGTTLYGRRCMRERGVYVVVRELHKTEIDERIGESVLRLVNILKREESRATLADHEGGDGDGEGEGEEQSKDQMAIDELIGAEDASRAGKGDGKDDNEEDDLVIEEL